MRPAHSLDEYCTMFRLRDAERAVSILGVGDGAGSFNAEGTAQGMRIVSVDPLYASGAAQIREQLGEAGPVTALFLADYEAGVEQGRYVSGTAAELPYPDGSFDLALCAHSLFVDDARQDLPSVLRALRELLRVAEEVRVFPLPPEGATPPRHLRAVMMALERMGMKTGWHAVTDVMPHGASQVLAIWR